MKKTYKYNAFISYRQLQPDIKVANRLHKALERYKLPKSLVKKGFPKKISKVFKDVEELSATPDLAESIREALIDSEYLIVICSPRTKESKWVKKEIDTFIELGRSKKILTLIIEGSIEETIPSELMDVNKIPLASDVRDENEQLSIKKLKDAKLKLIAPIIGCDYDDLVQRQAKEDKKFLWMFSGGSLFLASVFIVLAISLKQTNNSLEQTNKELNQAIFETSAIYAQFLLPIQNDYDKWSTATGKLIEIIKSKNIDRALKANSIMAKYISSKGYKVEDRIDILPFLESPKYFLKTLFFRKAEFTIGYIEGRYISLFLLENVEFPANLFLFLAKPPIQLPDVYQRMESAEKEDLIRYGYFFQSINYESNNEHDKALIFLDKSAQHGFFHSITYISDLQLDTMNNSLHIFDDTKIKLNTNQSNERLMTKNERLNLVKHINIFFLLSIHYSTTKQDYISIFNTQWQNIQVEDYGRISYKNIVDYIAKSIDTTNNKELKSFLYQLKYPLLSDEEKEIRKNYKKELLKLKNDTKNEILEIFKQYKDNENEEILKEAVSNTLKSIGIEENNSNEILNEFISLHNKDTEEIDKLISKLSSRTLNIFKTQLNIPKDITTAKEIRIYIAKQIRPYNFHLIMYDKFITDKNVFNLLSQLYNRDSNNSHIRFALSRYYQLKGDKKKADSYLSQEMKTNYFKDIEQTFRSKM